MRIIDSKIEKIGVIPVVKLNRPEQDAAPLTKALCEGGVPAAEVTFRAAGADIAIRWIKEACPEMLVGAGTVLYKEQVDSAVNAGAEFIVTPGFDPELIAYCQERNIPIYPGCTTPTDYHAALKFGLEVLKFFPAEQSGGLPKIKAMSAPFPMFRIMPTGGISLQNLETYLSCPTVIACGGSYMVSEKLLEAGNWAEITTLCQESAEIVRKVRER